MLYYIIILLYSVTSNEFILGLSLMLKNIVSILSYSITKNMTNSKQRLRASIIPLILETILVLVLILNLDTLLAAIIIFIYSFMFVVTTILLNNLSQIPLFDSMTLLAKHCKTDYEYMSIRQMFLNIGRAIGIYMIISLPTDPIYALGVIILSNVFALLGAFLCNKGSKIILNEVLNEQT